MAGLPVRPAPWKQPAGEGGLLCWKAVRRWVAWPARWSSATIQFLNAYVALSPAKLRQVLASYLKVSSSTGGDHSSWVYQRPSGRLDKERRGISLMNHHPVVIIGAGPAGLTAAYELIKRDIQPVVLEKADKVGGLARTEKYKGYRFDIGGHRFFTKFEEVQQLWQEMLGEDFLRVPRLSRIYYQGLFFNYPLAFFNTLSNLGLVESLLILLSYFKTRLWPYPQEETFEEWVTNRFGQRLYKTFFQTYTEKVWGIPCH
ncbi:MAG: NAD(P)-binding protein, partial [Planctomycetota bacterium]